jgi:hypothetical protein
LKFLNKLRAVQKTQASTASLEVIIAKSRRYDGLPLQEFITAKNHHCEVVSHLAANSDGS